MALFSSNMLGKPQGERVVVGMSGGVDSAVTAALLKEAGYEVIGVTLTLWQDEAEEEKAWQDRSCCKVGLARYVAKRLSIPHHTMDIQNTFKNEVIDDFCDTYLIGETPNPCVRCNARVKFKQLLLSARELGAKYLATGHYSRIAFLPDKKRYALLKAKDRDKDQSYFLYRLDQEQLSSTLFPLGELSKEAVYRKAADLGLPYEEILESQEICFVTQKDYRAFLLENRPEAESPGEIVTTSGQVVGKHDGTAFYTVGQRRGLGMALGKRTYVTRLEPALKQIIVGSEKELMESELIAQDIAWGGHGLPCGPLSIQARIRHRATEQAAELIPMGDGPAPDRVRIRFSQPQKGITPGQSVVFYQGDEVIGGGTITRPL